MAVNCDLARLVKNVSKPRGAREDVIAYYQGRYPGILRKKSGEPILTKKGEEQPIWKRKLAEAIQPYTKGKNGEPQKLEYIMRRFQTGRASSSRVSKAQQEQYKALGSKLPFIPPAEGVHITGTLCMKYQDDPCEDREFDIDMVGEDFEFFLQSFELQSIVNVYMYAPADYGLSGDVDEELSMFACECPTEDGECVWEDIVVTPIGEDHEEPEEKPLPNKGYTTKPVRPKIFKQKTDEPFVKEPTVKRKTQAEIVAELDEYQKSRGKE